MTKLATPVALVAVSSDCHWFVRNVELYSTVKTWPGDETTSKVSPLPDQAVLVKTNGEVPPTPPLDVARLNSVEVESVALVV